MEHKHAAVLRAIADGKAVQWRRAPHGWEDHWNDLHGNPLDCLAEIEWRIKPEPKPDVVRYLVVTPTDGDSTLQEALHWAEDYNNARIFKVTFNGQTGDVGAEVLP